MHLSPANWTSDNYFARCERNHEHRKHREEVSHLPALIIEELYQLALFDEVPTQVWDRIIGKEI